jgi:ketosteroid isomerase-like protein
MNESPDAAAQEPGEDIVPELVDLSKDWAAAIVANDAARIAGFMADEWVIVSESGIDPKERFLSLIESGVLTHSAMDLRTRPRVRVYGDTAVVTGRVTNTAHYQGERHEADEWTTDVFVKRRDRWLCVLSHITSAAPE